MKSETLNTRPPGCFGSYINCTYQKESILQPSIYLCSSSTLSLPMKEMNPVNAYKIWKVNTYFQQEMCQFDTDAPNQGASSPKTSILQNWSWKWSITPIAIGGFYTKTNLTYILIIYLCIKNESNTLIFFKRYQMETIFRTYRCDDEV